MILLLAWVNDVYSKNIVSKKTKKKKNQATNQPNPNKMKPTQVNPSMAFENEGFDFLPRWDFHVSLVCSSVPFSYSWTSLLNSRIQLLEASTVNWGPVALQGSPCPSVPDSDCWDRRPHGVSSYWLLSFSTVKIALVALHRPNGVSWSAGFPFNIKLKNNNRDLSKSVNYQTHSLI